MSKRGYLFGPIDESKAEVVCRGINSGRIDLLWLHSDGGEILAALAIADAVRRAGVSIIVTGTCCSAAVLVLLAAPRRFATPSTAFLMHAPSGGDNSSLAFHTHVAAEMIASGLGIGPQTVRDLYLKGERWFGVEEAIDRGFVHDTWLPQLGQPDNLVPLSHTKENQHAAK